MIQRLALIAIFIVCLFIHSVQAELVVIDTKRIDLEPLAGSEWARENPGFLPYEKCFIARSGDQKRVSRLTYGYSTRSSHSEGMLLFCYTQSLRLAFAVPIAVSETSRLGLLISLDVFESGSEVAVRHLDERHLGDLFGIYQGMGAQLSAVFGFSKELLKNQQGITLHSSNQLVGVGASLSYDRIELLRRANPLEQDSHVSFANGLCLENFYERRLGAFLLTNGTENRYEHLALDPISSYWPQLDWNRLNSLQFLKVKPVPERHSHRRIVPIHSVEIPIYTDDVQIITEQDSTQNTRQFSQQRFVPNAIEVR